MVPSTTFHRTGERCQDLLAQADDAGFKHEDTEGMKSCARAARPGEAGIMHVNVSVLRSASHAPDCSTDLDDCSLVGRCARAVKPGGPHRPPVAAGTRARNPR